MKLLIIGGTKFLGPHLVQSALARNHEVTLFNRGRSHPGPVPGVENVRGDRETDLSRLSGRRWDAVIDTSGQAPRLVRLALQALAQATSHYTFVSTISVYVDPLGGKFDEDEPVATLADPTKEEITPETYGGLKAACEREVASVMPGNSLIIRPGLIVGPLDPSDRFTYWPHRIAQGGDVLVPAIAQRFVSFIDVRDLAAWMLRAVEERLTGTFNATGVYGTTTMGDVIESCLATTRSGANLVWVDESFLLSHGVTPWTELPLWVPEGEDSVVRASPGRAVATGLTFRPLHDTVVTTLAWTKQSGLGRPLRAGLTRERETDLLAAWEGAQK